MTCLAPAALVLFSAALSALAFPPWSVPGVGWVALVPFLRALNGRPPRHGALLGLLWGTAAMWGVGHWVPAALAVYYEQPLWFGIAFSFAASVVFAGSYSAGFGACACWAMARTRGAGRVLLLASLWVAWEFARARLLTGDPWLLLGYALAGEPRLAQVADVTGVYGLSGVLALVNATLAELPPWREWTARRLAGVTGPAIAAVLSMYAYGAVRLHAALPQEPRVPVAVVQGNIDLGAAWRAESYGEGLERYLRLTEEAARRAPHLIVWPESATTFFLAREPLYLARIGRLLKRIGADLVTGAPHFDDGDPGVPRYHNSAFAITSDGTVAGRYDKVHLLPFGEYFPLRTIEFLRRRFERVRSFTPGTGAPLLPTPAGRAAIVICFEGIFPELVRARSAAGADIVINLSNDVWLGSRTGPEQHLAMVALRAIESRTWVIRATTTGISAVIDPYGRIAARTGRDVAAVLHAEVVPMQVSTWYERLGDLFAHASLLASLVAMGGLALSRRSSSALNPAHQRQGRPADTPVQNAAQRPPSWCTP